MSTGLLEHGSRLGKYQVLKHIATGGMGAIYKALDVDLRRNVALKVLPTDLAQNAPVLERFRREARHAAQMHHPNIVTLFEYGYDTARDLHFLAMEYVRGIDLRQYIEGKGKLHPEETRQLLMQAAAALCHANEKGVVHRDIKPSNFLLTRKSGRILVKLTDLGLARRENDSEYRVTREGSTVGTIDYLSPEQARNSADADIRSDIYALGCTAYHMLAGRPPFSQGGLGERLFHHLQTPPPDVREFNPKVSESLWAIVQKMLEKKPEDRYATPVELLEALKSVAARAPKTKPETEVEVSTSAATTLLEAPESTPPPPPRRKRRKREEAAPAAPAAVAPEQDRAAVAFFERAVQVLGEGGGDDYARQLLMQALAIDPFKIPYREALRDINSKASGGLLQSWFGSINVLAIKSKLHLARSSGNWRKVLEHGEEILARYPADVDAHTEMAYAAKQLGSLDLAVWLCRKGVDQAPASAPMLRAAALAHEDRKEWKVAAELWERVRRADPYDANAVHKINVLLAEEHIAQQRAQHESTRQPVEET